MPLDKLQIEELMQPPPILRHSSDFTARRPSREERFAAGKRLRKSVPRGAHAVYRPSNDRPDPVDILQAQDASRLKQLVPIKYARMLASPFAFLRGSAAIMAHDLSTTSTTGLEVVACGDTHVSNFGVFGSAERKLIFAINDFDEVYPAPWEWDLKRLVASAAVVARFMGGDDADAETAARAAARSYRKRMRGYAFMGFLEVWYDQIDDRQVLDAGPPDYRKMALPLLAKARGKGNIRALDKLTRREGDEYRFVEHPPLIVREAVQSDGTPMMVALDARLRDYMRSLLDDRRGLLSRYRIVDFVRKVVGVGSAGTSCWALLLQGVDSDDPLFLQVKQAGPSVLAPYVRTRLPFKNEGRRVVVGQRVTQGSPDIFLGWGGDRRGDFYVRQLVDMKGGAEFVENTPDALDQLNAYCGLCGWALALAHAKSGDPAAIAGYCGKSEALDDALGKLALAYMRQNERDYRALQNARATGRVKVAKTS